MHSKDVSPFELFSECGVSVLVVNEFYKLVTTTFSWCRLLVVPHNIVACRRAPLSEQAAAGVPPDGMEERMTGDQGFCGR